jgi:hypothetical protein
MFMERTWWFQKFDNIAFVDPSTAFQSNHIGKYSDTKLPKENESLNG